MAEGDHGPPRAGGHERAVHLDDDRLRLLAHGRRTSRALVSGGRLRRRDRERFVQLVQLPAGHRHGLAHAGVDRDLYARLRRGPPRQAADVDGMGVARSHRHTREEGDLDQRGSRRCSNNRVGTVHDRSLLSQLPQADLHLLGRLERELESPRWRRWPTIPSTAGRRQAEERPIPRLRPPPGSRAGQSNALGSITLSWPASTDDLATTLSYSIERDGAVVGNVSSSSTTIVSFTDTGLVGGSTHTYVVTASDGQNTSQDSPTSDPITVQQGSAAIFQDGFDVGLANWTTVSGVTLDQAAGQPAPSARTQMSASNAWAIRGSA